MMERVNKILANPQYQEYLRQIQSLEADRKFCGHTIEHFLDVARLSFILAKEEGLEIDKEVIYATALLHDIGRYLEYTKGISHHEGSAIIAQELLSQCGFAKSEQAIIQEAILGHRKEQESDDFVAIFYRADKLSRNCFSCAVESECNWPIEKKNMKVIL